jgi:hypothetical protein
MGCLTDSWLHESVASQALVEDDMGQQSLQLSLLESRFPLSSMSGKNPSHEV